MANILVTGASGFIGANLVRSLLNEDNDVSVFMRDASRAWRLSDIVNKLRVYPIDLTNKEEVARAVHAIKPELVFHCATYGGYPSQKNSAGIMQTNVLGSLFLFEALEACASAHHIINIGSSSEYGLKQSPMRETDALEPSTPYGVAKVAQTLLATHFAREKNLPIVTLRPLSVYGPYEELGRLISDIMIAIVTKKPLMLSSPAPRRDFVFTDDIIEAFRKAIQKPAHTNKIYNIGNGKDYSVGDVINLVKEITDTTISIIWGSQEKMRSFNTSASWVADISKAREHLDWQPRYSLQKGLEKTYQWYQKNIHLYERA